MLFFPDTQELAGNRKQILLPLTAQQHRQPDYASTEQ